MFIIIKLNNNRLFFLWLYLPKLPCEPTSFATYIPPLRKNGENKHRLVQENLRIIWVLRAKKWWLLFHIIIIIIIPEPRGSLGHHRLFLNQFPPFFSVLHCPVGLGELQICPFPGIVFPLLPLSALPSSSFHCAMLDGFGQTWWTEDMTGPLQFVSLYDGQEVYVWSGCQLDLGTDFLVGNTAFVWDV